MTIAGDIGCYTLGAGHPWNALDTCTCMGGSMGMALGMDLGRGASEDGKAVVAVIGDSTFLHMGMPGLLNIVYEQANVTVMLLDNGATGMTGGQDHPGTGRDIKKGETPRVNFAQVAEAFGVRKERIRVVDPSEMPTMYAIMKEEIAADEPSVIITNRPCTLIDCFHKRPPFMVNEGRLHRLRQLPECRVSGNFGDPDGDGDYRQGQRARAQIRDHRQCRLHRLQPVSQHLRPEGHRAGPGDGPDPEPEPDHERVESQSYQHHGRRHGRPGRHDGVRNPGPGPPWRWATTSRRPRLPAWRSAAAWVASHLRFGDKVLSSAIGKGEADILVGFEPAEAFRWSPYLRDGGVAMVNTLRHTPPVVSMGLFSYPEDPIADMRKTGVRVFDFDAGAIAQELGEMRLVNTIMLGAIADHLPFPADTLKSIIVDRFRARKPALADLNARAFDAGQAASSADASAA